MSIKLGVRKIILKIVLSCVIGLLPSVSLAQSLSMVLPATNVEVQEGDDFATQVLNDPWDFSQRRDFGWEANFDPSSVSVSNGIWQATNENGSDAPLDPNASGFVMPLFPGFSDYNLFDPLPGDKTLPKFGLRHKIDSSKYTYLSFRLNQTDRSNYVISWDSKLSRFSPGLSPLSPLAVGFDGFNHYSENYANVGWNIYSFDMTKISSEFDTYQGDWTGQLYGLRIEPSLNASDGAVTKFDWIRLVDPDSAPMQKISWDTTNIYSDMVVIVYVDTDNSGFNGTPIAVFPDYNGPGSIDIPTAMFPPGDYYFYVTAQSAYSGMFSGPIYKSGYSARLRVNKAPSITITSPSAVSGATYASTALDGDEWDMAGSEDVFNLNEELFPETQLYFEDYEFVSSVSAEEGGSIFRAKSILPETTENIESIVPGIIDDFEFIDMHLPTALRRPIDTKRFRYLTYRQRVKESNPLSPLSRSIAFGESEVAFWNIKGDLKAGRTKGAMIYEGWHTYTVDLWDGVAIEGFDWQDFEKISHLSLEPTKATIGTVFEVDWVKLTEDVTTNSTIDISFKISDFDSDAIDYGIYFDSDNQGFNGEEILSVTGETPGSFTEQWDVSGVPSGRYYIYIVASDGFKTVRRYSSVSIDVNREPGDILKAKKIDYDGDRISDHVVYRPATGKFFQNRSASFPVSIQWVSGEEYQPVQGDFDGDGVVDIALVFEFYGALAWYIHNSSTNTLTIKLWGVEGDKIVVADYNGNGIDEISVYRDGQWFILDENDGAYVYDWGFPGDIPVPGDYDGDEVVDLAIWRPTDGTWWILNSGFATDDTDEFVTIEQWGLGEDIPVPGYWFNNTHYDLAVWRPSLGIWFMLDVETEEVDILNWGLPGDVPVVADFNGDSFTDATVYRPELGMWFHNYRNGFTEVIQFGLPEDRIPLGPR